MYFGIYYLVGCLSDLSALRKSWINSQVETAICSLLNVMKLPEEGGRVVTMAKRQ